MSRPNRFGVSFRRSVRRVKGCCYRVEKLLVARRLAITDCELIYESAFLSAVARFEGLLNQLLVEFICGKASRKAGQYTLLVPRTRQAFTEILSAGRSYVDLMPYKDCVEISKRFLNDGHPFSDVDPMDRNILANIMLIRNAIAHKSNSALSGFRKDVPGVAYLPPAKQFPGAYLRVTYRAVPPETWSELYFNTLEKVGLQLASAW